MKILIAVDMEGISGVVNWDQVDPNHVEYQRFRRFMTGDVNAAVRGAIEGGASEVIIADGHWNSSNILIEELDHRARLNSGTNSIFSMVQGISDDTQGVFFIGYHARAGTPNAILDHTWSSKAVFNVWLNGVLVGEIGLNAAVCGSFGVPVIMISGDQSACAEARELLGPLETVVVKQATSRFSAECLPILEAQAAIEAGAARALKRLQANTVPAPYQVSKPVSIRVEFHATEMADVAGRMPGTTRLDGRIVELSAPDMPAAYKSFRAVVTMARSA